MVLVTLFLRTFRGKTQCIVGVHFSLLALLSTAIALNLYYEGKRNLSSDSEERPFPEEWKPFKRHRFERRLQICMRDYIYCKRAISPERHHIICATSNNKIPRTFDNICQMTYDNCRNRAEVVRIYFQNAAEKKHPLDGKEYLAPAIYKLIREAWYILDDNECKGQRALNVSAEEGAPPMT